jgi:chromosome segregation ATPase
MLEMAPEVEREARDAEDAQSFLETLEQSYAEAGSKLKQARSELERAHRDMSRAGQQRAAAERQADAARRAAGLASSTSGLSVALKAMKDSAERDLASAEAAVAKSRLLAPTRPEKDDGNIAAAMAQSQGKAAPSQSLTEAWRCARGRRRAGAVPARPSPPPGRRPGAPSRRPQTHMGSPGNAAS